jgi:CRP/FNR family cyclic AMP-dependent transcriptional regulator
LGGPWGLGDPIGARTIGKRLRALGSPAPRAAVMLHVGVGVEVVAVEFCRPCPARSVVARGVVLRGVGNVDRDPDLGRVDSAPVVALMADPWMVADREVAKAVAGSFLAGLPADLVAGLLAAGERTDYPAGSTIYRQGSYPRTLLVVGGLLRVYMSSPEGRQVTIRYARPGDVLGIAVLVGGPADVGVQTLAESGLFRVDAAMLRAAAHRHAGVAWALAEELNRRLYDTLQQAAINTFGSVRQRVAAHLLDLASAQQRPGGQLMARVSQQELADAVGSVREVVARVLREFRRDRLVATAPDRIHVLDPAGLHTQSWNPATP